MTTYSNTLALDQEEDDAFLREMLSGLHLDFPRPEPEPYVPGPSVAAWAPIIARVKAGREACERIRARHGAPGTMPAPAAANDDAPVPSKPAPPLIKKSKIGGARPRKSLARDRRNVSILEGFVPDVRPAMRDLEMPVPVAAPPTPLSTPSKPSITSKSKREKADESDTRKAPAWRYTTEIIRGHAYIRTISTTGPGLSWSLNLDGKVLDAANDNPDRFMGQMQDRLSKALNAEFGETRDAFFAIELSLAGRPHLHGAVDATENERERVEAVLARCGGTYTPAAHTGRQAHAQVMFGPDGWLRYSLKNMAATKRALGLKTVLSVTRGCRARAEALWEASR